MLNDYCNGAIIGIVQTIVGHPFDTIKVNIQNKITNFKYNSLMNGVKYPIYSNVISNLLIFGNYGTLLRHCDNNIFYSSVITGITNSFIINHLDYIKVNKQIGNEVNILKLNNSALRYTVLREMIATPIYFISFNFLINHDVSSFISGGISGVSSWLFTYNIDTIKTRIQINNKLTFDQAYNKGNLYSGIKICLLRAFLVNGIGFAIYEKLKNPVIIY